MSTLDDKLLGEKLHYYCSSSEDEDAGDESPSDGGASAASISTANSASNPVQMDYDKYNGSSTNTGPKGVIKDFQRWKQLEAERRDADNLERLELAKKLSITCKTLAEEEEDAKKQHQSSLDQEFEDLRSGSDPFLEEYVKKRMEEMITKSKSNSKTVYGRVLNVKTGAEFLDEIERENNSNSVVICHIYSPRVPACITINRHLGLLAVKYKQAKFITVEVSSAGMSQHFEEKGVPAILVYKNGSLIGNFVRVTEAKDFFGRNNAFICDFEVEDTEAFLVDHGFLPDLSCIPTVVQNSIRANKDAGSDEEE